ncbi:hypothetical protein BDF19DRAFT_321828 [Syncephalis fuscata]|nr:hypothetical protein BDF19DRAFT_321828 [Syncephalis fuscata]
MPMGGGNSGDYRRLPQTTPGISYGPTGTIDYPGQPQPHNRVTSLINEAETNSTQTVDNWLATMPTESEQLDLNTDYPRDYLGRIISNHRDDNKAWHRAWTSNRPYRFPATTAAIDRGHTMNHTNHRNNDNGDDDDYEMEEDVHLTASVLLAADREQEEKEYRYPHSPPPSLPPRSNADWGASLVALLASNNNNHHNDHRHNSLYQGNGRQSKISHYDGRYHNDNDDDAMPIDIDHSINAWYADGAGIDDEDEIVAAAVARNGENKQQQQLFKGDDEPYQASKPASIATNALRSMSRLKTHTATKPRSYPAPPSATTGLSRKKSLSDIFAQIVAPGNVASTIHSTTSGRRPASTVPRWTAPYGEEKHKQPQLHINNRIHINSPVHLL